MGLQKAKEMIRERYQHKADEKAREALNKQSKRYRMQKLTGEKIMKSCGITRREVGNLEKQVKREILRQSSDNV